jgi:outer membrane cobalamin receptor
MPVTKLGAPDADAILRQITTESVVTAPKADFYLPLYSALDYAGRVSQWLSTAGAKDKSRDQVDFDFNKGSKVDEKSFKHTSGGSGLLFDYVPWLSLGVNAQVDKKEENMFTHEDQLKTTFSMSWDDRFRAININSGKWYVEPFDSFLSQHIAQAVTYR